LSKKVRVRGEVKQEDEDNDAYILEQECYYKGEFLMDNNDYYLPTGKGIAV
jgi:uncharacterized membrane-anchored protein